MRLLICTQAVDQDDPVLGFFVGWIREFARRSDHVTILCLREGRHDMWNTVTVIPLQSRRRVFRALQVIGESWRRRTEYDAVFVHMNPEYLDVSGWLWRLMHKKVVLWYMHKSTSWTLRLAMPFVDVIATASKESFRLASEKVRITGHGIETDRAPAPHVPSPNGVVRLITAGRIAQVKHVDLIIHAYCALKQRGGRVSLRVFGAPACAQDESYRASLDAMLADEGETPKDILVGPVPHNALSRYRAEADYFISASDTGSIDKAVLSAAFDGVIPLASSEAYTDFFGSHAHLLQYQKGDAQALADRILTLMGADESERANIRTELHDRVVREHSLTSLIDTLMTFLAV